VLITLDLPTFDRPRNATSGKLGAGNCAAFVAAAMNRAMTLMSQCAMPQRKLASKADASAEMRQNAKRLLAQALANGYQGLRASY